MPTYVTRPAGTEAELLGVYDAGQLTIGTQVNVAPSEAAVFVKDGEPIGMLGPGQHELTHNIPFTEELLTAGTTSVCFVTTTTVPGIEVGGSLGAVPDPSHTQPGLVRAYAEIAVQVVDPAKLISTVKPTSGQDLHGWLNAKLFQAFQKSVTELVTSGEVSVGTLANSSPLVDHHLCSHTPELEAAGVRVVELTSLSVPETGPGSATRPTAPGALADVAPGHTVIGEPPMEALAPQLVQPTTADVSPAQPVGGYDPASAQYGAYGQAAAMPAQPYGAYTPRQTESKSGGCAIGAIIAGLLLAVFAAVGIYAAMTADDADTGTASTPPKTKATRVKWSGRTTYSCRSGTKRIDNINATLKTGTAIRASGSCSLQLVNVSIQAPVAIQASSRAKVTVDGGTIRGTQHSIDVADQAKVILKGGATVRGGFKKAGAGNVLRLRQ